MTILHKSGKIKKKDALKEEKHRLKIANNSLKRNADTSMQLQMVYECQLGSIIVLRQSLKETLRNNKMVEGELQEAREKYNIQKKVIDNLATKLNTVKQGNTNLCCEKNKLTKQVENKHNYILKMKDSMNTLTLEKRQHQSMVKKLNAKLEQLQGTIDKTNDQVDDFKLDKKRLKNYVCKLQSNLRICKGYYKTSIRIR